MKDGLTFAFAVVGVVVGAGIASGQEIMQFFTFFGWVGGIGALIATGLFMFLLTSVIRIGSEINAKSHYRVLQYLCGKYLAVFVDLFLTFFLFGILVIMIAGGGSLFDQQFGLPVYLGSFVITVLTIATLFLNFKGILYVLGVFTPIMFILLVAMSGYSAVTTEYSFEQFMQLQQPESAATFHWLLGACLFVSNCVAASFPMLSVMGGSTKNKKALFIGGMVGGLTLGLLTLMIHISIFSNFHLAANVAMPTLIIASDFMPLTALIFVVLIFGMIFNTAVGMLYSFTSRMMRPGTMKFKLYGTLFGFLAFGASFVGFTDLVNILYPITGLIGFILMGAITIKAISRKKPTDLPDQKLEV
ncbi:hypothetical protein [Geomicrobium sediminis]|uniref:Membrane protein YkvI n=1 Tax=Geomicrobium sediminis TaxID=1347788 RepID=A0ABS2PBP4_9BACL|nr:hypothetical protein [Geomicrobium sediminis]MBM7632844.1 putative membrane protein YkvI [Geomicrobium sediminis]